MNRILKATTQIRIKDFFAPLCFLLVLIPSLIFRTINRIKGRKLWIVSEEGDARDNGYHFYKHVREKHPNEFCFYAVDPKTAGYKKVENLGNTIKYGSLKHWLYYMSADLNISSQKSGNPCPMFWYILQVKLGFYRNRVFLQHGITKDDAKWLYYAQTKFKYFVCAAQKEYDFILKRFGYKEEQLLLAGFPRWDALKDENGNTVNKSILIMPTWRNWLGGEKNAIFKVKDFEKTDYYKYWNGLLNNRVFIDFVEKNDIRVYFYPHVNMAGFIKSFKTSSKNIKIVTPDQDIQKYFSECDLMITDYSSVAFDFAYINKPVVYYQFDKQEYRKKQYQEGYFNYDRDGFGPVVKDERGAVDSVVRFFKHGFNKKYFDNINNFFGERLEVCSSKLYELISGTSNIDETKIEAKDKKIKLLFVLNTCRSCGPVRVIFNIIKNLDRTKFDPVILTLVKEPENSKLEEIRPYISEHIFCDISKIDILSGRFKRLKNAIREISPDVIHTTGVFPDYSIAKVINQKQIITIHNYAPFDFVNRYGFIKGKILLHMQRYAINRAARVFACSDSLATMYNKSQNRMGVIKNGIDIQKCSFGIGKMDMRRELGIAEDAFVFVSAGRISDGKNVQFALKNFSGVYGNDPKTFFIVLGDGPELKKLKTKYVAIKNIIFCGNVADVSKYLVASDVYVSASKSEGMPNSVLEAMGFGLPVLLSDIPQHLEILNNGEKCGYHFTLKNDDELAEIFKDIRSCNKLESFSVNAQRIVADNFSDVKMSDLYQEAYTRMMDNKRITLFIGSLAGGGAERVTCNLANYLNDNNYKVDVLTMSKKNDVYELNAGIRRISLIDEGERSNKISDWALRDRRLKQYIAENRDVSCYVVMLPITIFMLMRHRKDINAKIIISERNNPSSYRLFEKMMMRYSAGRCDGIIAQTGRILDWYKTSKCRAVIPNAINKDVKMPTRDKVDKKIVAVGRLSKQKNYPMLIKAFAEFAKMHPDYTLEIYGNGLLEGKIRRLISKKQLSDKVVLCGYEKNIAKKIASATCFVMTSNYEGMPNALIEAMCIGLPCVTTDFDGGAASQLIANGQNGFIVPKNSVKELAERMSEIVEDEVLAGRMSMMTKNTSNTLNPDKIYGDWQNFIEQVEVKV